MESLITATEAGRCPLCCGTGTVPGTEDRAVSPGLCSWTSEGSQCPPRNTRRLLMSFCPSMVTRVLPSSLCSLERRLWGAGTSSGWLPCPQYPVRAGPAWYLNRINKAGGGGLRDRKQRHPSAASFLSLPLTCLWEGAKSPHLGIPRSWP